MGHQSLLRLFCTYPFRNTLGIDQFLPFCMSMKQFTNIACILTCSIYILYHSTSAHIDHSVFTNQSPTVGHSGCFRSLIPLLECRRYEKNLGSIIWMQTSWSIIKYGMELETKEYTFLKCAWYHQITLKRVSNQEYISIHFTFQGIIHILIKTTLRRQHCLQEKKNLLGRVQWDCRLKTHLSIQATYLLQKSY